MTTNPGGQARFGVELATVMLGLWEPPVEAALGIEQTTTTPLLEALSVELHRIGANIERRGRWPRIVLPSGAGEVRLGHGRATPTLSERDRLLTLKFRFDDHLQSVRLYAEDTTKMVVIELATILGGGRPDRRRVTTREPLVPFASELLAEHDHPTRQFLGIDVPTGRWVAELLAQDGVSVDPAGHPTWRFASAPLHVHDHDGIQVTVAASPDPSTMIVEARLPRGRISCAMLVRANAAGAGEIIGVSLDCGIPVAPVGQN